MVNQAEWVQRNMEWLLVMNLGSCNNTIIAIFYTSKLAYQDQEQMGGAQASCTHLRFCYVIFVEGCMLMLDNKVQEVISGIPELPF